MALHYQTPNHGVPLTPCPAAKALRLCDGYPVTRNQIAMYCLAWSKMISDFVPGFNEPKFCK